jgi:AraC-like DNA-binding protein
LLVRVRNLIELRRKLRSKYAKELVSGAEAVTKADSPDNAFVAKLKAILEEKSGDERFGSEELAEQAGLTLRQLQRKLKGLADTAPNQFIRSYRLNRAMAMLKEDGGTVSEIAYSVGFSSPQYFARCFQEEFGTTPSDVRKATTSRVFARSPERSRRTTKQSDLSVNSQIASPARTAGSQ